MKKIKLNKLAIRCTLRKALKGTNKVVHAHFHAGIASK